MTEAPPLPHSDGRPSEPKYDLFVVHANADRFWVEGYLKTALGLEPGRTITPRDFDPTATVPAEFERAVTSSRFTLLVLSPAFLADEWARFGEQLVSFASVEAGQVRLLAVEKQVCDLPLSLRFRVRLDFTDPNRWNDEMARLRAVLDRPAPVIEAVPCPYPGMVPFRKQDARFFHGRDREIQTLLTLIRHNHFLVVVGSSGSGKSSLVTAGLLPRLDDPRNFPRGTWRVLTLRPGATPIEELSRTFGRTLDNPGAAIAGSLDAEPAAQRLLLVVDQFEELFSQVKDDSTRDAFIASLKALRADPRCTVIMTMRADFYGDLMNSALWPIDRSQIVEVASLRGESLRQAIIKPAEASGVYLEDGLVERLLADAADEPGSLPMLQEAMVLLWGTMSGRLLTRASYETLGHDGRSGLAVAMATKADATLVALPPQQQRVARRIFLRLVQFGEGRPDTRRQLGVDALRAESDDPGVFDELLQELIANRLLTPSPDEARGLRVDIAHEMLIIGWPASREWVESRREAEKTRRRLVVKAEEWVHLGRGDAGLLDATELAEADRWLATADAVDLGIDADFRDLGAASRRAIKSRKQREIIRTRVTIGGLTAALVAISGIAYWGELKREDAVLARSKAEKSDSEAKTNAAKAVLAKTEAEKNAADVLIGAGSTALANGHTFDAMHRYALAIRMLPDSSPLRAVMSQSLGFLAREVPRLDSILEHAGPVRSVAFSPDGTRVVTASDDKTARVWTVVDGRLIAEIQMSSNVMSAAFSPDGARVLTLAGSFMVQIWNAADGKLISEMKGLGPPVNSASFSPNGTVVAASGDRIVRICDTADGKVLVELKGHTGRISSAAFSPDGARIVTASWDKSARVWNVADGSLITELKGHTKDVKSALFSPDGRRVVTSSWDETARIYNSADGRALAELKGHANVDYAGLYSATFSPDGTQVLTASSDKAARVWNASNGSLIAELKGHTGRISSTAFSRDGRWVLTASIDKSARIWNAADGKLITELKGHVGFVDCAAFSPDGRRVVTASSDQTARVWNTANSILSTKMKKGYLGLGIHTALFSPDRTRAVFVRSADRTAQVRDVADGKLLAVLTGHTGVINSAAFNPRGTQVLTASDDKTARVWNAADGTLVAELKGHVGRVMSASFSPDGARVVTASDDKTARVWDAADGTLRADFKGNKVGLNSAKFSPDGARVVTTASWDQPARVWNASSGSLIAELKGHSGTISSTAFSPDGARVVAASGDKTALVWNAADDKLLAELKGHTDWVRSVAFSPDGLHIVTASADKSARVWNAADGTLLVGLEGHADAVTSAMFSPDGARVVTASDDKTARLWNSADGLLLAELKGHAALLAVFSLDGARVVTASLDQTIRIWRFEAVPGEASTLPLWIEVLTGTEMKGSVVQPLALIDWKKRKDQLHARDKRGVFAKWFEKSNAAIDLSTGPVKK